MTYLNLTRSLADVWGLTPDQVAQERAQYAAATLPKPFRRALPEARVIDVVPPASLTLARNPAQSLWRV